MEHLKVKQFRERVMLYQFVMGMNQMLNLQRGISPRSKKHQFPAQDDNELNKF